MSAKPMANSLPGLHTPWPDHRRWACTRRLLSAWLWAYERGEDSEAARNARKSLDNRLAGLGIEL